MTPERKTVMVSIRMTAALVARAEFIARNTTGELKSRSAVMQAALEAWLPDQEQRLEQLGIITKKAARVA